jgi:hypothetical protein
VFIDASYVDKLKEKFEMAMEENVYKVEGVQDNK